ncbi:hypothetical protein F1880_008723 [Penicillium rolfsii]|nr:hypothetical protein F1880_008723 [Penicillium rolfsii]
MTITPITRGFLVSERLADTEFFLNVSELAAALPNDPGLLLAVPVLLERPVNEDKSADDGNEADGLGHK